MRLRRTTRSKAEVFVETLRREATRSQIAWSGTIPADVPRYAEPERPLPAPVAAAVDALGITRLYQHQATVVDRVRRGENVVLATPTASGKTLAFSLPIVERLLAEPSRRALYVYPTNALVNDQWRALAALTETIRPPLTAGVLTGATSIETRRAFRAVPPRVLLTNPEMLHLSLAGAHAAWSRFLGGLQFLVLDELHLYRGLFGAHMALSVRRLLRVAGLHGAAPQIVGCSATIGNPGELAEQLTGRPFSIVEGGAARGQRTVLVWQPAGTTEGGADPQAEAVGLFCRAIAEGLGTIVFALTRRGAEAMLMQARERLPPELRQRVAPYRNGYTPEQRREVEEGLKTGRLLGVVSTNALEVGIDIGGLDVAIIAGFPGSRSSFWQQAGRAGRGAHGALVIYVPYERVVDAYYAAHPEELLGGRFEDAVVDLANPLVVGAHLACAAAERELQRHEPGALSPTPAAALQLAEATGTLLRTARGWAASERSPHGRVNLRADSTDSWLIAGPQGELGSIDGGHLYREAFPGAVYLHQGGRYRVLDHDDVGRIVRVEAEPRLLITDPVLQTAISVVQAGAENWIRCGSVDLRVGSGVLRVEQATTGYRELHPRGRRHERTVVLPAPLTRELQTTGCWIVLPDPLRRRLEAADGRRFAAGLHALEHVLPAALSLSLLCDPHDVIASYELSHATLRGPTLFVADARAGGAGIAVRVAERLPALLGACMEIVRACACKDGCPACILSSVCWRQFDPVEKPAALALLSELAPARPG